MKKGRIAREQKTVACMIQLYCNDTHHPVHEFCENCLTLLEYSQNRLTQCPYQEDNKPTCKKCPKHCYNKEMRERIRTVMRYAGPRMLFRHPVLAVGHIVDNWT